MTPARPDRSLIPWALWIAQGFGVGVYLPFAARHFRLDRLSASSGFFLLLAFGEPMIYGVGSVLGIILSIWAANRAEKILEKPDPSSVVIDEIAAIPFCFIGLLAVQKQASHPAYFQNHPSLLLIGFITFRLFDILKPWPVNRSQRLPGGWGITVDDLLAAGYVNLIWMLPARAPAVSQIRPCQMLGYRP